ncbi:hypothetical protein PVAP13_2NG111446 [Panicum virgatum]|uniref:Uncharacterized protein n=1 Tax=Panicum virgatum TaxID=38727 RepID=A0A8T0VDI6_PANVG|nr:hypothetical protein PVAP13_2NG111446 [Panicum virgatum]
MFAVAACGLCSWEWFLKWEWGGMWTGGGRGRGVQRQRWWPPTEAALAARHGRREPTKPPSETGQLGTARKAAGSRQQAAAAFCGPASSAAARRAREKAPGSRGGRGMGAWPWPSQVQRTHGDGGAPLHCTRRLLQLPRIRLDQTFSSI